MQTLDIICKFCGSGKHIVRYGTYKGIQRYFCRNCERKFSDTDSPEKMRYPSVQISSAITMFYEGMSRLVFAWIRRCVWGTPQAYALDTHHRQQRDLGFFPRYV